MSVSLISLKQIPTANIMSNPTQVPWFLQTRVPTTHCSKMNSNFPLRGHSTTTWTEFCHFLTPPPPPPPYVDSFYSLSVDKSRQFLTQPPSLHLVHVVIEWPLNSFTKYRIQEAGAFKNRRPDRAKYCRTWTTLHFSLKREMGPIIEKGWVIMSFEGVWILK